MSNKRSAGLIEESRPRKRRKVKFPRLEGWGEFKEQEQDTDSIITIQDYVQTEILVKKADQEVSTDILIDQETNKLLSKSRKLQERKVAISTEVQKKKFKFNTRGKLRKDEIMELKRTHKKNIFSWLTEEKAKVIEMDTFEEKENTMDREIQLEVKEMDLDREDRLHRVKKRQKEFMTRRMVQGIIDDLVVDVSRYRQVQMVTWVLEEMLDNVGEHAMVNRVYQEVLDFGPTAMSKLEGKVEIRQSVKSLVGDMMEWVVDRVALRERKSMQERRRKEWRENWEALEMAIALEMDILMEIEPEDMDTSLFHNTTFSKNDLARSVFWSTA